ncbi:MAG: ParB N-terminal domain-containing protein, partial [Thermoplasmata archaeon]|nr:ParB N-terminal domain-containing protein [Thermoplasmata archaeon]
MTYPIVHFVKDGGENHPLKLEILLERVDRLIIHEETIRENLEELRRSFKRSSYFWHPIIVDRNTRVVLDGMHRVSSLKELGYKYIPILTIDAMNPYVKLERWIRCYTREGEVPQRLEEYGFKIEEVGRGEVREITMRAHDTPPGKVKCAFHLVDLKRGVLY